MDEALRGLAVQGAGRTLVVVARSLGSVMASDHFYDLTRGANDAGDSPLERGET